ncbi:tetratricopeptide repeat protein [Candidatus Acetothermia bacterium]|nr:tetratricopeptide repeat protein [Candidatus Acetothermia bacterium]
MVAEGRVLGLKISLLGQFQLIQNDQPIPTHVWPSENTKSILKILAGERGRLFLQDELIEHLWPDVDPERAAANLRGRVAELRKILEPTLVRGTQSQFIVTRHGGYVLAKEADCWIDMEEFSRLESKGRQQEKEGRFKDAAHSYEAALHLCRGDYLAENRYEEWALQPKDRWRERRVDLLSRLAECSAKCEEYREAIKHIKRALEIVPTQENFYQQWIRYAHQLGDFVEAKKAYDKCVHILKQELDLMPSPHTQQLYETTQSHRQLTERDLSPIAPPVSSWPQKLPFVGREEERLKLSEYLRAAQAGAGPVILLRGRLGMGKTRLADEICAWATAKLGACVLTGHCYELETPLALQPLLEAIDEAVQYLSSSDLQNLHRAWLAELAELVPRLGQVFPDLSAVSDLPAEYRRNRLFETLHQILAALAQQHSPLVLRIEDLQWADPSTVDFLNYLLSKLGTLSLVVLGTYRTDEVGAAHVLHRFLQHSSRLGSIKELTLEPLSADNVQQLLNALSVNTEGKEKAIATLYEHGEGNPFFITSQIQALFEEGALGTQGKGWSFPDEWPGALPASAKDVIRHRVERMPPSRQRVLQIIATWGEEIQWSFLEKVWEGERDELQSHLQELISSGFLVSNEQNYSFSLHAYREMAYEMMDETRRKWLHWQIVHHLRSQESKHSPQWKIRLAHHCERAGHSLWAIHYVVRAVHDCRKHYENNEGLKLTEKGHHLLDEIESKLTQKPWLRRRWLNKKFQLLREEAWIQRHTGKPAELEPLVKQLAELFEQLNENSRRRAELECLQAALHERSSRYDQVFKPAQTAREIYRQLQDLSGEAECLYEIGRAHFGLEDYGQARQCFVQSASLFRKLRDYDSEIESLNRLGNVEIRYGNPEKGLAHHQQALRLSQRILSEQLEGKTLRAMGHVYLQVGNYEKALKLFEQSQVISEKFGDYESSTFAFSNKASAYYLMGAFEKAADCCRQALTRAGKWGNPVECGQISRQLGWILKALGRFEEARACLESAIQTFREMGLPSEQAEGLRRLAETDLAMGEAERALTEIRHALSLEPKLTLTAACCYGTASAAFLKLGHFREAVQAAEEALRINHQMNLGSDILANVYFRHFQALYALPREDEALASLQKAHSLLSEMIQNYKTPELRRSFMSVPWRRELLDAAKQLLGIDN